MFHIGTIICCGKSHQTIKPNAVKPLPDQLIEINKRRRNGTETVKDIMLSLGANIDLDIYLHPYKDEILQSAPKVIILSSK